MDIAVLDVQDLHTSFFTYEGVFEALRGVNFSVGEGEILGIVGESGCGKSVLARSILRRIKTPGRIVRGNVRFLGEDILAKSEHDMRRLRGRDIALIVSNPRAQLNPILAVGAQLVNIIRANGDDISAKDAEQRALDLIAAVSIGDPPRVMRTLPHELSGGMCQRVLIAMALSSNPKLLLADEPSHGLDVTVQLQVLELMRGLVENHAAATIIMTRDLGIVAHYCHRVIVMHQGKILETADVRSFFAGPKHQHSRELLRKAFAAVGEDIVEVKSS